MPKFYVYRGFNEFDGLACYADSKYSSPTYCPL